MTKEELFAPIREKYHDLKQALKGTDIDLMKQRNSEKGSMWKRFVII